MKVLFRSIASLFFVLGLSLSFSAMAAEAHHKETSPQQQATTTAVNINTADAQAIINAHIKGIGKKRAEAIVAYRSAHGPFKSLEDLKKIKGLSGKILDANKDRLLLN